MVWAGWDDRGDVSEPCTLRAYLVCVLSVRRFARFMGFCVCLATQIKLLDSWEIGQILRLWRRDHQGLNPVSLFSKYHLYIHTIETRGCVTSAFGNFLKSKTSYLDSWILCGRPKKQGNFCHMPCHMIEVFLFDDLAQTEYFRIFDAPHFISPKLQI